MACGLNARVAMTFGVSDTANTFTIAIVRHSKNGLNQQQNKTKSSSLTTKNKTLFVCTYVHMYVRSYTYMYTNVQTEKKRQDK